MGLIRKSENKDILLRRARLGAVKNAEEIMKAAKEHGIETCPVDLVALARQLEIEVRYQNLDPDHSGYLEKQPDGRWLCVVNARHHSTRQRFTIAHEVGHFLLHINDSNEFDKMNRKEIEYSEEERKMESEANQFASELLMPESEFVGKWLTQSPEDVAAFFGVSPVAALVRAKLLGLASYEY